MKIKGVSSLLIIFSVFRQCQKIIRKGHAILTSLTSCQQGPSRQSGHQDDQSNQNNLKVSICESIDPIISIQSNTPLSKPLYIEIEGGEPSPYLKQLLNKVGPSQIQFLDFTLEGNHSDMEDIEDQGLYDDENEEVDMSVIEQEQEQNQEAADPQQSHQLEGSELEQAIEQYVPNMHLLDLDHSFFTRRHFNATLQQLKDETQQKLKQFLLLYLTDDDLEAHKDSNIATLVKVSRYNLQKIGIISRLQRKAKVTRYLQKKKKRIWRKKINYDCRKKVADNRLRVKGKFVTKEQACQMLGIESCSQEQLKAMLKKDPQMMF